jgi:hypothetical protein
MKMGQIIDITSIKRFHCQLHVIIKTGEITSTYMKLRDMSTASGRRDGRCRQARIKRATPVHNTANPCLARDWPAPTPMSTNNPHGVTTELLGPYTSRDLKPPSFALVDFTIAHRPYARVVEYPPSSNTYVLRIASWDPPDITLFLFLLRFLPPLRASP